MNLGLQGKTALITGASAGIGRATARELAAEGCRLVLAARTQNRLDAVAAELAVETQTVAVDLSQRGAADMLAERFPDIDILVNNAGAIPGGSLPEVSEDEWRAAWDLKVFGYIAMCRAFYPLMKARGRGVIINVVGIGGLLRDPRYICGVAGNAGLTAFSQALGSESHRDGIRVIVINPGPVATERLTRLNQQMQGTDGSAAFAHLPLGRAAHPEEIAAAIAFAASERSAYTSGAIINIDGGRSARAP